MFWKLMTIGGGIFCIWASVTEQEWFFNHWRARPIVKLFGMNGAKIFYIVLGVLLIVMSLFI